MRDSLEIIIKDGHVFCLKHQVPWKKCSCAGQVEALLPITKEDLNSVTPKAGAYIEAVEASLGEV